MDIVELPNCPSQMSLKDSLQAMRSLGKSAVVRDRQGNYDLLKAAEVFWGISHQVPRLQELESRNKIFKLSIDEITEWNLDPVNPHKTWGHYEKFLDSVKFSYALLSVNPVSCLVVTRHEEQTIEIGSGPKDCYCDGPYQHGYPPPNKGTSAKCDLCPGTIYCYY